MAVDSMQRLDRQYRGAEEKISEFRDRLREARLELATRDRQLDAARKLLAKMGQEKSELAVRIATPGGRAHRLCSPHSWALSPEHEIPFSMDWYVE
jgi:hypothetical protein